MKKLFYVAAIAAMSLTSCSNDEILDTKQDEIRFNVVANNASRAANIYCNNNMPEDFKVYAFYDNDPHVLLYIDGDVITRSENGVYVNSTNRSRFWPETSLDFVALKNFTNGAKRHYVATGTASYARVEESFTVAQNVADQVDLLYAITPAQTREIAKDGVKLNFRHALSQVVFNAKNLNSALHVEVTGVKVGNVANKGYFDIMVKNNSTEGNYNIHEEGYDSIEYRNHWRAYNNSTMGNSDFEVLFADAPVTLTAATKSLTSAYSEGKEFSNTAMLMIPQATTAWDIKKTSNPDEGYALNDAGTIGYGTYIAIKCKIWNIAGAEFNAETDVKLYDGWAYIPADFNWKEGKKYTYTLIINDGAGYDDGGIPVLHKITYSVTVDDFDAVDEIEKDMSTY